MSPKKFKFWCAAACTHSRPPAHASFVMREVMEALNACQASDVMRLLGAETDYGSGPSVAPWRAALFARTTLVKGGLSPEAKALLHEFIALCEI